MYNILSTKGAINYKELYKNGIYTKAKKDACEFLYNASIEQEKDIAEKEKLQEKIKAIEERIKTRAILFSSILKGILIAKPNSTQNEQQKLIQGGEDMKYQGISIIKNTTCNTWYARPTINGKQIYISAKTQKDCYNKLKLTLREKHKLESPTQENKITFIEWYNKWLELYKRGVKENTKRDYVYSLEYIKPIFEKELNKITSIEILELLNKITFERRKQKVYELVNSVFEKAVDNDIINKNPLARVDKPKHKKINGQAISNQDEKDFEKYLKLEKLDMFLVCLYQGLRKGEMLALTIDDFDFNNKTLSINKSLNDKDQIDTTKNTYSVRVIPLFEKTIEIMQKYRNKKGRVFDCTYKQSTRLFEKFIRKYFTGKKYTAHSLRHTFITRCQENNIPLHIIQKWVGHAKGSIVTSAVYTHTRERAEMKFADIFNKKLNLQ